MKTHQKNQTPTQTIKNWIRKFVTKPNPVFGNLPPCPFAQKAIIDDKVDFVELNSMADWRTVYGLIWNFDFDKKKEENTQKNSRNLYRTRSYPSRRRTPLSPLMCADRTSDVVCGTATEAGG